uniref:Haloacid dehalogenase-like hydrolase domain-containing protein 3 n=2 Tax=Tetranychus urticae TaxID=32264 RepID=T1KSN7_TETUR
MQTIRLITFDVTNTLIKFKSSVGYEYCKIADLYGIKCNNENTVKAINSNFTILMKQLKKESPFYGVTEGINCNQWWHRLVVRTFSVSGIEMSPEMESKLKLTSTHL